MADGGYCRHRPDNGRVDPLTAREREVLSLLARGLTEREVADELVLSPETVKTHQRTIQRKLVARNRTHAVAIAIREGIIDAPDGHDRP